MTHLLFAGLENIAVVQEEWLHLVDTCRSDENEVEDSEEPKLEVKRAVSHFPKCETAEQGCEDMQNDLAPDIVLDNVQSSLHGVVQRAITHR